MFEDVDRRFAGLDAGHPGAIELGFDFVSGDLPGGFLFEELVFVEPGGGEVVGGE